MKNKHIIAIILIVGFVLALWLGVGTKNNSVPSNNDTPSQDTQPQITHELRTYIIENRGSTITLNGEVYKTNSKLIFAKGFKDSQPFIVYVKDRKLYAGLLGEEVVTASDVDPVYLSNPWIIVRGKDENSFAIIGTMNNHFILVNNRKPTFAYYGACCNSTRYTRIQATADSVWYTLDGYIYEITYDGTVLHKIRTDLSDSIISFYASQKYVAVIYPEKVEFYSLDGELKKDYKGKKLFKNPQYEYSPIYSVTQFGLAMPIRDGKYIKVVTLNDEGLHEYSIKVNATEIDNSITKIYYNGKIIGIHIIPLKKISNIVYVFDTSGKLLIKLRGANIEGITENKLFIHAIKENEKIIFMANDNGAISKQSFKLGNDSLFYTQVGDSIGFYWNNKKLIPQLISINQHIDNIVAVNTYDNEGVKFYHTDALYTDSGQLALMQINNIHGLTFIYAIYPDGKIEKWLDGETDNVVMSYTHPYTYAIDNAGTELRTIDGYSVVKHEDGSWTVAKVGKDKAAVLLFTNSSGTTYALLVRGNKVLKSTQSFVYCLYADKYGIYTQTGINELFPIFMGYGYVTVRK